MQEIAPPNIQGIEVRYFFVCSLIVTIVCLCVHNKLSTLAFLMIKFYKCTIVITIYLNDVLCYCKTSATSMVILLEVEGLMQIDTMEIEIITSLKINNHSPPPLSPSSLSFIPASLSI